MTINPGFRSLAPYVWPIYAPWMAASLGMSVLLVALPILLIDAGQGYAVAGVVAGAGGAGATAAALPTGWSTDRWGPARVGVGSLVLMVSSAAMMAIWEHPAWLGVHHFLFGAGSLGVMLSRQADLTARIPVVLRGRAMSLMGGSMRFSVFLGTAIGGVLVDLVGARGAFVAAGLGAAIGLPAVLPGARHPDTEVASVGGGGPHLGTVVRRHRRRLLHAGLFGLSAMATREGRMVLLPLVGVALGLAPSSIGILVAAGYAADLVLFPVSGMVMDRFGRRTAMVPAYGLLAGGLLSLMIADSSTGVLLAGLVMGVGNGLSSGSLFTLSSDVAPAEGTATFLSAVSLLTDGGRIVGPVVVGVVADQWGLDAAALALSAVMVAGVLWLGLVVGETGERSGA
ncbi:MAG: MFS transporter [Actinomycetota bacterium]|nr:MFS transporter [Actinomycetota bacterium]